ncbi:MAG: hypothetical protein A2Y17_12610 [Clostridiales bacterium GWF2_38_85]|nr:MAG: hypothetical protein A2Y17_12610 [Clostridiales bacterium GWF2_38_85]HBL84100.1 hypothetical protein [Clostridiales bacterium]
MKKLLNSIKDKRNVFAAIAVLLSLIIISSFSENNTLFIVSTLMTLIYIVYTIAITLFELNGKIPESSGSLLSNLTVDFFMKLDMPVLIINDENMIIWYNKAFGQYDSDRKILYGKSINTATDNELSFEKVAKNKNNTNMLTNISVFGISFEIRAYQIISKGKNYYLTIWYDNSKLIWTQKAFEASNPLIAYIVVDNLSEIIQNIQEDYRTASANVARVLNEWAVSIGAILKEYERDKFIMLFSQKYLETMINNKFEVLDKIKEQTETQLGIPLTVTIGISNIIGSFSEKENIARQALEYGLQRGGDQAVVKSQNDTQIFGGKTRTVQKRTKIRSRIIAHDLIALINSSSNVLIMGHKYADYDSLGAAVGISRLCLQNGKVVNIISNSNDINLKQTQQKLDKVIAYHNIFVDKITGQDLINSDTLLIIVDVNNRNLFESFEVFDNVRHRVIIDHHRKTEEYNQPIDITYIEPSASSASELVCEILEQVLPANSLEKEEAELLFAGLMLDTKQFSRNSGIRTFGAAVFLRGEGANPTDAQMLFKTNSTDFIKQAKFESNTIIYRNIFAISAINDELTEEDKIAAAKAADRMLSMDGVLASFVLCQIGNVINISARSSGTINVQLILENIGGGGRYDVAGAQLESMDMEKALVLLKESIDKYSERKT